MQAMDFPRVHHTLEIERIEGEDLTLNPFCLFWPALVSICPSKWRFKITWFRFEFEVNSNGGFSQFL